MPTFTPDQVVCRPALLYDTSGMLELTSQIWEGEDYLPKTWRDWLVDSEGLLAVAELHGQVVGLGKLTKLSQQDWWLEGLRVHPQFEGRGIASHIHRYLLGIWKKLGDGAIRFATESSRKPVIHLAKVNAFRLVGEYSTYKSTPKKRAHVHVDPFIKVKPDAIKEVVEWFSARSNKRWANGLLNLGWQFAPPRQEILEQYLREPNLWWWNQDQGLLIMVEKKEGENLLGRIRQLVCDLEHLVDLLLDARDLAAGFGYSSLTWLAPISSDVEQPINHAGFYRDWESSLLIFERTDI